MNDSTENQLVLLRNNITAALRPMGEEIMKQVAGIAESFNNAFSNGDLVNTLSTLQDLLVVGATAWGSYRVAVLTRCAKQSCINRDWLKGGPYRCNFKQTGLI